MVKLETKTLKALDKIILARLDLVLSKFSRLGAISDNFIALILDIEFS